MQTADSNKPQWVSGGSLYLVGTPIGNLSDWSERAREVLAAVDVVLAEDTRVTGLLLHQFGIEARLLSFHAHNTRERIPGVLDRLAAGQAVALVSDRGMPAVADPGRELVDAAHDRGYPVSVVPGPSAALAAFALSGFPHPYVFWGFLPRDGKARRRWLSEMQTSPFTGILYEAPHHIEATLAELASLWPTDRTVLVARELTKRHEEIWRGPLSELIATPRVWRGELTLVVSPPAEAPPAAADWDDLVRQVVVRVEQGEREKTAVRLVAEAFSVNKRELYHRVQTRRRAAPNNPEDHNKAPSS